LLEENKALSLSQPNDEDLESMRRSSSFHFEIIHISSSSSDGDISSSSSDGVGEESGEEHSS
jgi:hypothetical protein